MFKLAVNINFKEFYSKSGYKITKSRNKISVPIRLKNLKDTATWIKIIIIHRLPYIRWEIQKFS